MYAGSPSRNKCAESENKGVRVFIGGSETFKAANRMAKVQKFYMIDNNDWHFRVSPSQQHSPWC
jgi:hypothetical protein